MIKRLILLLVICATHGIIHAQLSVYNNEQAITQNNLGIEYCLDSSVIIDNQLPKKLYPFQEKTVDVIIDELEKSGSDFNLLYQLPTGGGKTEFPQPEIIKAIPESNRDIKAGALFIAKS